MCCKVEDHLQGTLRAVFNDREEKLRRLAKTVDLLVAGPPCQGHSDLNNHSRRQDSRNSLYARVGRAALLLRPKAVLIENVSGVRLDRGHVVGRVEKALSDAGYEVHSLCLDASKLGVAQRRRRHFLIAFLKDHASGWSPITAQIGTQVTVSDVLADLEDEPTKSTSLFCTPSTSTEKNMTRIDYLFENGLYELPDAKRPKCHRDAEHSYRAVYGRLNPDCVANTITGGFGSMGQGRYVHPSQRRLITPHEAARLQGFPDWFSFRGVGSRGSLQGMIGNAVVPRVAAVLVRHLIDCGVIASDTARRSSRASTRGSVMARQ